MGKGMHGRFQGTAGSASSAHTLNDNLPKLTKKYPLKNGYFWNSRFEERQLRQTYRKQGPAWNSKGVLQTRNKEP